MTCHIFRLLLATFFLAHTWLLAIEDDIYLDFAAGLRYDALRTKADFFDANNAIVSTSSINIKHVPTMFVGFTGKYTLCNWYFRGFTSFGWIAGNGRYDENSGPPAKQVPIFADIRRATTIDFDGGLGYLFNIWECFGVAPIVGFSYNMLRVKMDNPSINGRFSTALEALKYTNWWQGPWCGVDFIFSPDFVCGARNFVLTTGYEFHLADWRASWRLEVPDVFNQEFSDTRRSTHAYGHVLLVDARWNFWDCWNIGFGTKLQDWTATQGSLSPSKGSFTAVSSTIRSAEVKRANWRSAFVYVDIGWNF